jgi:hypothetical protein
MFPALGARQGTKVADKKKKKKKENKRKITQQKTRARKSGC